jgi:hypothetical protein
VSPYNLWSVRAVRGVSLVALALSFILVLVLAITCLWGVICGVFLFIGLTAGSSGLRNPYTIFTMPLWGRKSTGPPDPQNGEEDRHVPEQRSEVMYV